MFDDDDGPFVSFREQGRRCGGRRRARGAQSAHARRALAAALRGDDARARSADRVRRAARQCVERRGAGELATARSENALRKLGAQPCETPFGEGLRLGAPLIAEARAAIEAHYASLLPVWARATAPGAAHRRSDGAVAPEARRSGAVFAARRRAEALPARAADSRAAGAFAGCRAGAARGGRARMAEAPRRGARRSRSAARAKRLAVIDDRALRRRVRRRRAAPRRRSSARPRASRCAAWSIGSRSMTQSVIVLDYKTDRPAPADAAEAPGRLCAADGALP